MSAIRIFFLHLLFLVAVSGCRTIYQSRTLQYQTYRISAKQSPDSSVYTLMKPYGDSVYKSMNDVVGYAERNLDKIEPECTLGNFIVDAFYYMAKEKYATAIDVAFMNYGGIRLTQLPAGEVTRGKIFELMPFDNVMVLQKLRGDVLQQLLDLIAEKGGWPVAGITMKIKDNKAIDVMIGGKPIDKEKVYTTVNSDFVANGGDNADMLRNIPQITNGYLMRDAIFDYIKALKSQGKKINSEVEGRVIYVK